MTEQMAMSSFSNSRLKHQTHHRVLATDIARVLALRFAPSLRQGRRKGRAPAGTRVRAPENAHGVDYRSRRIARPSLRDGVNVSFVLSSGSAALLPPSPLRMIDARARSGRAHHRRT